MKTVTWLALVCAARACAQGLCDTASFNRNPITGQGGVDGRAVITGHLFQLGDFDDCLYRQQAAYCLAHVYLLPTNITSPVSTYIREHGQRWTHWRRDSVRWAVCVPRACRDAVSLELSLEATLEPAGQELGIAPTVSLRPEDCQTSASDLPPLTPADYFLGSAPSPLPGEKPLEPSLNTGSPHPSSHLQQRNMSTICVNYFKYKLHHKVYKSNSRMFLNYSQTILTSSSVTLSSDPRPVYTNRRCLTRTSAESNTQTVQ